MHRCSCVFLITFHARHVGESIEESTNDFDMQDAECATKLRVDSGSRNGCDMAGTAAQQEIQDACRLHVETELPLPWHVEPDENRVHVFEALLLATGCTVNEHASMQDTRCFPFLRKRPTTSLVLCRATQAVAA